MTTTSLPALAAAARGRIAQARLDDLVAARAQRRRQVAADEAARAQDRHSHRALDDAGAPLRCVEPPVVLGNVQALRAVAALMVVVVHAYAVESTYLPGRPWTTPFHILGTYGVDLFFVDQRHGDARLDGDLVRRDGRAAALPRAARDAHLPAVLDRHRARARRVLDRARARPASTAARAPDILASFLALPQRGEPLLVVGWTLTYELVFYCVFALALRFQRRYLPVVTALWLLRGRADRRVRARTRTRGCACWAARSTSSSSSAWLIGAAVLRGALVAPRALFALAVVLIVAVCVATAYSGREFLEVAWWRPLAVGVPMALLVYAALGLEKHGLLAPRWLRAQGDASYALYLWHVPVHRRDRARAQPRRTCTARRARIAIVFGGYALAIAVVARSRTAGSSGRCCGSRGATSRARRAAPGRKAVAQTS